MKNIPKQTKSKKHLGRSTTLNRSKDAGKPNVLDTKLARIKAQNVAARKGTRTRGLAKTRREFKTAGMAGVVEKRIIAEFKF